LENSVERRGSRRYTMALPLSIREAGSAATEIQGETRDVSFRGLYFTLETGIKEGSQIEFVLTLPKKITLATDVHIRCSGIVLRVEPHEGRTGVAAQIERYEFLPQT
jgi:hypothetical protein